MVWDKIKYSWRWFATIFSFFMFGVGGVFIPVFVVPIIYLLPGDRLQREYRGQKFIHYSFRALIWMMKFMGVLTYHVSGKEKLKEAKLILANHPSLLDIVFLISFVPNANCVVKSKLIRNPFMRGALKAAGYIVNDRAADDVIIGAMEAFDKGSVLIVFPEGTRTTPSQSIRLKRGAANIALRAGVDITPVIIECVPTTLTKEDKWYQIPDKRMHFRIQIKDKIEVAPYLGDVPPSMAARKLTNNLSGYFNKEVGVHE